MVAPFLRRTGASDSLIGLLNSISPLATLVVPILVAGRVEAMRRKKPYVLRTGLLMRVHFFAVPVLAVLLLPERRALFLVLYVASMIFSTVAGRANVPAWSDLVAKVTPVDRRGFLFAWRGILGFVPTILAAGAVGWVLRRFEFPYSYALLFLTCGVAFTLSLLFVALIRERAGKVGDIPKSQRDFLRDLPRVFRRDPDFAWFVVSRGLISLALSTVNIFFVLTAEDRFGVKAELLAAPYMVVSCCGTILGSLVFAKIGDRYGHKLNIVGRMPLFLAACLLALFAQDTFQYGFVFVLMGLFSAAGAVSNQSIILEFGGETERPRYIALWQTVLTPVKVVGPLLGGLLRQHAGIGAGFGVAMGLVVLGTALLAVKVEDPRKRAGGPDSRRRREAS